MVQVWELEFCLPKRKSLKLPLSDLNLILSFFHLSKAPKPLSQIIDMGKSPKLSLGSMVVKWWLVRWWVGVDCWMGLLLAWVAWLDGLIDGNGGAWWFDMFMWVSNCKIGWLVCWSDWWLLVGLIVVLGFRLQGIFWVSMFWLVRFVGFEKAIDQKCKAQWCGLGLGLGFGLLLLCLFQISGFVFFVWIWWFFWIYGFDFLEILMEDKDFEWIFACLFAKKMQ